MGRPRVSDVLVAGTAEGEVLALDEPLSFWGGVHEATGVITDIHHPQHGLGVAGRVLVMPAGRGSSSSSSVLAELIRAGVAPAAIILGLRDPIIALGALVAESLYGHTVPVLVLSAAEYARVSTMRRVRVRAAADGMEMAEA
jgi:predicted aconitase with swiveling domain